MSGPTERLTGPLAYAPKWARDAAIAEKRSFGFAISEARFSDDVRPTERFPAVRSLDPVILPRPPTGSRLRVRFAIASGLTISAAAGAITTLFVTGQLPPRGVANDDSLGAPSFEARFIGEKNQTSNLDLLAYASQLAHVNVARQRQSEEPRLAEPLRGSTEDQSSSTAAEGPSPPARANEGPRLAEPLRGSTEDQSSSTAAEGPSPPARANEEPRLVEPLRGTPTDHASGTTTSGASPTAPANEERRLADPLSGATVEGLTKPASPIPRALNPDEIAAFLKRGQELMASGDIAAARVLLLRAAEARDPKAALALAATFDPIILERARAYGVVPDVSSARRWYEKAKEFGSEEAPRRLEMLARRGM
jgi:hypothetical protein